MARSGAESDSSPCMKRVAAALCLPASGPAKRERGSTTTSGKPPVRTYSRSHSRKGVSAALPRSSCSSMAQRFPARGSTSIPPGWGCGLLRAVAASCSRRRASSASSSPSTSSARPLVASNVPSHLVPVATATPSWQSAIVLPAPPSAMSWPTLPSGKTPRICGCRASRSSQSRFGGGSLYHSAGADVTRARQAALSAGPFKFIGGESYGANFSLDGQRSNGGIFGQPTNSQPSLEAVGDINVLTNNFSAEYGGIANIRVTTKRGSAGYHGSIFYNNKNSALAAWTLQDLAGKAEFAPTPFQSKYQIGRASGR